jgi:hypothetical protein
MDALSDVLRVVRLNGGVFLARGSPPSGLKRLMRHDLGLPPNPAAGLVTSAGTEKLRLHGPEIASKIA